MASRKNKSKVSGFLFGPILVLASVCALWQNEVRFDYHMAAKKAEPAASLSQAVDGANISHTGAMDTSRTLSGRYIETFIGYLDVRRYAEIYCWDRDEDSEGRVRWEKRWMSSVENNSRNEGLTKKLESGRLLQPSYEVGELEVLSEKIEFVDARKRIDPRGLKRTAEGQPLKIEGEYLMLH